MDKIVIITSYIEAPEFLCKYTKYNNYIICADGGYDIALKHNIVPDLLIGDFDSLQGTLPEDIEKKVFPPEKDYTDLELAVRYCRTLDASHVEIAGGLGGRLDHTVANIQILSQYSDFFDSLVIRDGKNKCFILNGSETSHINIPAEDDSYLSIFSLSEECEGVTFTGVKYPLENHTLTRTFPLGVSNEFKEKSAFLSIKKGTLLVVISKNCQES